jgi:hypothetical protein
MQEHRESGVYYDVQADGEYIIRGKLGSGETLEGFRKRMESASLKIFQEINIKRILKNRAARFSRGGADQDQKFLFEAPENLGMSLGLHRIKPLVGGGDLIPQKNYSKRTGVASEKAKAAPEDSHCA